MTRASWRPSPAAGLPGDESPPELFRRLLQGLVDDPHVVDDGHEVGVTVPARDHMVVNVIGNPGARRAADVDAGVEAVGTHGLSKDREGPADGAHEVRRLRIVEVFERRAVSAWC